MPIGIPTGSVLRDDRRPKRRRYIRQALIMNPKLADPTIEALEDAFEPREVPVVPYRSRGRAMQLNEIANADVGDERPGLATHLQRAAANVGRNRVFDPQSEDFLEAMMGTAFQTYGGLADEEEARQQYEADLERQIVDEALQRRSAERQRVFDEAAYLAQIFGSPYVAEAEGQPLPGQLDIPLPEGLPAMRIDTEGPRRAAAQQEQEAQRRNQAAFEMLQELDPETYTGFVAGQDYNAELQSYLADVREHKQRVAEEGVRAGYRREERESAAAEGAEEEAGKVEERRIAARRKAYEDLLDKPSMRDGEQIWQLQNDILDALAEGMTKQEILAALEGAEPEIVDAAEKYMRRLRDER